MKFVWMTAGAFGMATTLGCASEPARQTVNVEPKIGSVAQRDESACFDTTHAGAEDWIDSNCSAGGSYSYDATDPDGYHCMSCSSGGNPASSSAPGYSSATGGYEDLPNVTVTSGGGNSTPPPGYTNLPDVTVTSTPIITLPGVFISSLPGGGVGTPHTTAPPKLPSAPQGHTGTPTCPTGTSMKSDGPLDVFQCRNDPPAGTAAGTCVGNSTMQTHYTCTNAAGKVVKDDTTLATTNNVPVSCDGTIRCDEKDWQWMCICCDSGAEWPSSTAETSAECGTGRGACVAVTKHPEDIDAFASGRIDLGPSGQFNDLEGTPPTYDPEHPTLVGATYWTQLDDGDTVRLLDAIVNDRPDKLMGVVLGNQPWNWAITLMNLASGILEAAGPGAVLDQYNATGDKYGVYMRVDESFSPPPPPTDALINPGFMSQTYHFYLRATGASLGDVTMAYASMFPGGHFGLKDLSSTTRGTMLPATFYERAEESVWRQCE